MISVSSSSRRAAVEQAAAAGGVWIVEATIDRELDVRHHAEVQEAVDVALVTQTA